MRLKLLFCLLMAITNIIYADTSANADISLDQKIGQLLLVGFRGTELKPTDDIVQDILAQRIGGVVLYAKDIQTQAVRNIRNPKQLYKLTQQLQYYALQAARMHHNQLYPLLIAVDYEGGSIVNLKTADGFPATKSAAEIAMQPINQARLQAQQMAATLRQAGINMDFAPVLDVNTNLQNPIIAKYGRSFSADPNQVAKYANIFSQAFHQAGILCVYKHFPGHGSSVVDSHWQLVDVSHTWQPIELQPYQLLLKQPEHCNAIMTGHLVNRKLDKSLYPASLSYAMTTGLLRDKLGFDGVIMTDDLQMGAIAQHYDNVAVAELAINAGADILLFANQFVKTPQNNQQLLQTIHAGINTGRIRKENVEQAYRRVIALKTSIKNSP